MLVEPKAEHWLAHRPAEPQWACAGHLPDVMDYLADETRIRAVYVASQGQRGGGLHRLAMQVGWHVAGLGSIFLLDNAVTAKINEMVGRAHAVQPGTFRTYLPNVDLDDPLDPQRHWIVGIKSLSLLSCEGRALRCVRSQQPVELAGSKRLRNV